MHVPRNRLSACEGAVVPGRVVSHCGGSYNGRGGTSLVCFACHFAFRMKIVVISFDAGIVNTLFIWCDTCRRPRRDAPAADRKLKIQKNPFPPCLEEALRRGSVRKVRHKVRA